MRIISVLVALTALILIPKITLANQSNINETAKLKFEIKNNIIYIKDIPVGFIAPKEKEIVKVVPDERDLKIIERWKTKQIPQWSNLPKESFTINASAYTAAADECGKSDGITASGMKVQAERTLACPAQYPFGAKIKIEGYGTYTCEDRGGAIKGNRFDIYMQTKSEAFGFGRRNLLAQVVL